MVSEEIWKSVTEIALLAVALPRKSGAAHWGSPVAIASQAPFGQFHFRLRDRHLEFWSAVNVRQCRQRHSQFWHDLQLLPPHTKRARRHLFPVNSYFRFRTGRYLDIR